MEYDDVVHGRRSIPGDKPDPALEGADRGNHRPGDALAIVDERPAWNVYVITGEPLDRIRAGVTERNLAGAPRSRAFRIGEAPFAGKHRDRQVGVAKQLFSVMGAARDDKEGRQDWVMRGFRQFDAPVRIIVTHGRALHGMDDAPFDCGAVATALVNAAWSRGLGAVVNSQGIMQSPIVREFVGVADDQVIMKSIALGWPDETFPATTALILTRAPAGEGDREAVEGAREQRYRPRSINLGRTRPRWLCRRTIHRANVRSQPPAAKRCRPVRSIRFRLERPKVGGLAHTNAQPHASAPDIKPATPRRPAPPFAFWRWAHIGCDAGRSRSCGGR